MFNPETNSQYEIALGQQNLKAPYDEKDFEEFARSFNIIVIGMIVLVREAIYYHPENMGLVRKLNLISFDWKRPYTKDELMKQVSCLLRCWCDAHGCRIKDVSTAVHSRYWIHNNGWIERRKNWRPYDESWK